jgi:hypothetical protein
MATESVPAAAGTRILRVVWLPGSDQLQGLCHCGATQVADSPADIWQWLLGHPVGHAAPAPARLPDPPRPVLARRGAP